MKVLFVNRMAGLQRGGGETFDLEISSALEKLGCEVSYLAASPLFGRVPQTIKHPRVHYLRAPYLPWFPWDRVPGGWRIRIWEFQTFERKAAAWIRKHAHTFDVIQICELPYLVHLLKSSFASCPLPVVLRLTAPNAHDPWGGIQKADAVIASGTSIAKIRESIRPDVFDVPNGVDLTRFGASTDGGRSAMGDKTGIHIVGQNSSSMVHCLSSIRDRFKIPASATVLLYVARFQKFKNHELLLDAFSRIAEQAPEARLVLVGSGPLMRESEARCQRSDVRGRVIFLGETPFDQLPALYAVADVKVISSEYESFCFAAIEAMAAGLPVVTTDCGWVPGLIGDVSTPVQYQWTDEREDPQRFADKPEGRKFRRVPGGLVVMRGDAESLANAMLTMIRDAGMRDTSGQWNRKKAIRDHGWESSAKKLRMVYEQMKGTRSTTENADMRGRRT